MLYGVSTETKQTILKYFLDKFIRLLIKKYVIKILFIM